MVTISTNTVTQPQAPQEPASVPVNRGGRPPTFDRPLLIEKICEKLELGIPMTVICREKGMPTPRQVARWCNEHVEVASAIARSRLLGYDALAEQCLEIADDERHDWQMSKKGPVTDEQAIARAKLKVWTRMQLVAKWHPAKYGEKGGPGGTVNVAVGVNVMTEEKLIELQRLKKASIARNRERGLTLPPNSGDRTESGEGTP